MTTPFFGSAQDIPLLTTKLYIPPVRPELVSRPHLIEQLNAGLHRKLTLVSAPAGFGKTTLLSEWVASCGWPVAWVSLDEGDNDPVRFLTYFIAALQTVKANGVETTLGETALATIQSPQPPPIEAVMPILINEIAALPSPCIIILDDYHLITAQPIHQALTFLLDHQPPHMRIVLATRVDPLLPIARLRARGQLTELRQSDLRFRPNEISRFLDQILELSLSDKDAAALEARTEGWIAGLQMAAVSMQQSGDIAEFIHAFTGSDRYIMDYLVEEVLYQQSDDVQTFLLQTAILDRLSGPLCDAVCDTTSDAQAMLENLERANLFIIPLDNQRRWYRYHHLFADLLCGRLQRTYPNLIPALHHRASEWYENDGLVPAAIEHALAAQNFERAAHLINPVAWLTIQQGEYSTLRRWLEALPEEILYARPQLCLMYAWGLVFTGEIEAYERPLAAAEQIWRAEGNKAKLGQVLNLRADMAISRTRIDEGVTLARQALELLDEDDLYNRSLSWLCLGSAYYPLGELERARQALEKSRAMSQASSNVYAYTSSSNTLGMVLMAQGQLGPAAELFRHVLQIAGDTTLHGGLVAQVLLGIVLLEWYDLDAAEYHLRHALELLEQTGLEIYIGIGYTFMAMLLWARGEREQAQIFIEQGIHIESQLGDPFRERQAQSIKARMALAQGDMTDVTRWRETCGLALDDDVNDYRRETEYYALAQVSIAEDRAATSKVLLLLSRLQARAVEQGRVDSEIKILVITALAHQAAGDPTAALQSLERALNLAEPGGYVHVFVREGAPMAKLLRQAVRQGIVFSHKLLPALRDECQTTKSPLVEPLTPREMDVLRLIAVGLTNREIAQELVIAPSTVKVHIKHIYNKLDVANRTQAAVRARELELL